MIHIKIIFLILFSSMVYANTINLDNKSDFYEVLPNSLIYIDKSKSLKIEDIRQKDKEFKQNNKNLLGFGYSPDFNVWVKFTLKNISNKNMHKILEYDNALTSNIQFFSKENNTFIQEGLYYINKDRKTINPTFAINLNPNESKTYYIRASSHITTLILKLHVWDSDSFYEKEIKHQVFLALFFGAMIILALYNLFIYFFTKDASYLFYVLYMFGIIIHHLMYVGIANIYLLNPNSIESIIAYASIIAGFPTFALALFTKSFLRTQQYPIFNKILTAYIIVFPFILSVFLMTDMFNKYRNIFSILILVLLIVITIYASIKKNRQAYFVLFGWMMFLSAGLVMYLSSIGVFDLYNQFPYYIEVALVIEAIVFSIALADRIKQLQKDKHEANEKLITQQQNEKERLKIKVSEKTVDLKIALDEKGLLLKELNHRVKNNMQTIVSLIRLQSDDIEDEKLQDIFITIQNRINAMSHLHELLYKQDNISHVNAHEYFELLLEEVKDSYDNDVQIHIDINAQLKMEQAIYCGLILNELISNSFKYAFPNGRGNISIKLEKKSNVYSLFISDDGIGYNTNQDRDSLGLILVNTLAKQQLKGNIDIKATNGVQVNINWSNNE